MDTLIQVNNLSFSYLPKKGQKETLKDVNFTVSAGAITGLLGPNGSGKTTLFKILSSQIQSYSGEVKISGLNLKTHSQEIRKKLGVTFQSPSLDPHLSVRENLEIFASLVGLSKTQATQEIKSLLAQFRVLDRAEDRVKTLSGGLARRVEIAKSLISNPQILLLDEPTAGLDAQSRVELWNELQHLVATRKMTLLVTTHLMEEAELCDELIFMSEGRCVGGGKTKDLKESFVQDVVELGFIDEQGAMRFSDRESKNYSIFRVGKKIRILTQDSKAKVREFETQFEKDIDFAAWGRASLEDIYFKKTGSPLIERPR